MLSSGFANAPISRLLVATIIVSSIVVSIADLKYLFYINVDPHLWKYRQGWRLLIWQTCYTNATEVLFAAMTFYHMRILERLWGSRKFTSFILIITLYTALLPPLLLALILHPLSFNHLNYLPAGPTAILFALLAQYHAVIPHVYKFRIATSSSPSQPTASASAWGMPELTFSDKSTTYLLAAQLSLAQFPASLLPAAVGWVVGYAWRSEILPGSARWRIPGWVRAGKSDTERYDVLRRRLEGESSAAAAAASGVDGQGPERGRPRSRLGLGTQLLDQFRGRF